MKKKVIVRLEHPLKHLVINRLAEELVEMQAKNEVFLYEKESAREVSTHVSLDSVMHIPAEAIVNDLKGLLGITANIVYDQELTDLIQGARNYAKRMEKIYGKVIEEISNQPHMSKGHLSHVTRRLESRHESNLSLAGLGRYRREHHSGREN